MVASSIVNVSGRKSGSDIRRCLQQCKVVICLDEYLLQELDRQTFDGGEAHVDLRMLRRTRWY